MYPYVWLFIAESFLFYGIIQLFHWVKTGEIFWIHSHSVIVDRYSGKTALSLIASVIVLSLIPTKYLTDLILISPARQDTAIVYYLLVTLISIVSSYLSSGFLKRAYQRQIKNDYSDQLNWKRTLAALLLIVLFIVFFFIFGIVFKQLNITR